MQLPTSDHIEDHTRFARGSLYACLIAALWAICVPSSVVARDSAPSAVTSEDSTSVSDEALLKAINVALFVHGGIVYRFQDRSTCTVTDRSKSRERFETFYLNNIDASKITVKPSSLLAVDTYVKSIQISISGQKPVYRQHAVWPFQPEMQIAHTLEFGTDMGDVPRVIRAWWFLYSHGCKSAPRAKEVPQSDAPQFLIMNSEKRTAYIIEEAKELAQSGNEKDVPSITRDLEEIGFPEAKQILSSGPLRDELRRRIIAHPPKQL
jgi:hypothetical protein